MRMIDGDRLLRELTALSHGQVWPGWTYEGIRLLIERQPTLTPPNEWVSVEERMPKEHDSIFKELMGTDKWRPGMFERLSDDVTVAVKFADGTRRSGFARTKDGIWAGLPSIGCPVVTHWMPLPSPPDRRPPEGEA